MDRGDGLDATAVVGAMALRLPGIRRKWKDFFFSVRSLRIHGSAGEKVQGLRCKVVS